MRTHFSLLCTLTVCGCCMVGSSAEVVADDAEVFQPIQRRLRDGVVVVTNTPYIGQAKQGSGFLVRSRRTVVTSYHVVEGAKSIVLRFARGETLECSRVFPDRPHDLAILELQANAPAYTVHLPLIENPEFATQDAEFPQTILVIGHPLRLEWSPILGILTALRKPSDFRDAPKYLAPDTILFQLGIGATSGTSGAPVINKSGEVIGYYMGGPELGIYNINCCISHKYITLVDLGGAGTVLRPSRDVGAGRDTFRQGELIYQGGASLRAITPDRRPVDFGSINLGEEERNNMLNRFFAVNPDDPNDTDANVFRQVIERNTIYHIINPALGFGVLVPKGYEFKESRNRENKSYLCTISKPNSSFIARLYSVSISKAANEQVEDQQFGENAGEFVHDVLKLRIVPGPELATERNDAVIGPRSQPTIFRDPVFRGPGSSREYISVLDDRIDNYHYIISQDGTYFAATGVTFPKSALGQPPPPDELIEIQFIASSVYDMNLGRERMVSVLRQRRNSVIQRPFIQP